MNDKTLRVLEYHKIIQMLMQKATSSLGKEKCESLKPVIDYHEIYQALNETTEAVNLIIQHSQPPIGPIYDLTSTLKLSTIGGCLTPKQLIEVCDSLRTARVLKKFISTSDANQMKYPIVMGFANHLTPNIELEKRIELCIVSETEVSDNASSELRRIRRSIESKNAAIRSKLESMITSPIYQKYLQDPLVTIRQDRFVIPVKSEHKNHVKGLVHDQSAKGSTFYIEPMAVVELNNDLRALKIDEQKEIERILRELSANVADGAPAIKTNQEQLVELDFIFAKGKFSLEIKGVEPALNQKGSLRIKNGRHPLLPKADVVPSNIWLGESFTTLLITGPNTGGKTVTLKTVGLFQLMTQSGLHVPADYGTEMTIYKQVFADIGDEQSIEQSLSTFSSHMTNIVSILETVQPGALVLFDELGAGTDPTEGAALAMAILDDLKKQQIATIATTHYSELKQYAIITDGIENASVEFDVETLSPTYKLLIGVPGKSNAFDISRKLGLSQALINAAKVYVHQDNIAFEDIISNIEKNRKQSELERDEAIRLRVEAEKLRNQLKEKEGKWLDQKDALIRQAKEEAKSLLKQAKEESEEIIKSLRNIKKADEQERNKTIEDMRKRLQSGLQSMADTVIQSDATSDFAPENLEIGDSVRVLSINQTGTVLTKPNDKGEVTVQVGLMKMNALLKGLVLVHKTKHDEQVYHKIKETRRTSQNIRSEIDIRGQSLDEAIESVDKYLDDAALSSLSQVRIIHGKGTGVLRKGLHQHFRNHPHVSRFEDAAYNEGGHGATVVILK